jgi:hypothetical protein
MKAYLIRVSLIAAVASIGSTGVFAQELNLGEYGNSPTKQAATPSKVTAASPASYSTAAGARSVTLNFGEFGNSPVPWATTPSMVASAGAAAKGREFGQAASTFGRTLKFEASAKGINALHGETVRIENDKGQSFVWRLDTYGPVAFPLKAIAPKGFDAGSTWVYVDHPFDHIGGS